MFPWSVIAHAFIPSSFTRSASGLIWMAPSRSE